VFGLWRSVFGGASRTSPLVFSCLSIAVVTVYITADTTIPHILGRRHSFRRPKPRRRHPNTENRTPTTEFPLTVPKKSVCYNRAPFSETAVFLFVVRGRRDRRRDSANPKKTSQEEQ